MGSSHIPILKITHLHNEKLDVRRHFTGYFYKVIYTMRNKRKMITLQSFFMVFMAAIHYNCLNMAFSVIGFIYKKMLISHSHTLGVYFHITPKFSRAQVERRPEVSVTN